EQILRNFVSNAIKFTEQGSITLKAALSPHDPDRLVISVIDTGIGIPAEKKERIFEAFEQADSSISRRFGGTGLGLSIAKELAGLLGGRVFLDSGVETGSMFSLEVPIHMPTSKTEEDEVRTGRKSIDKEGDEAHTQMADIAKGIVQKIDHDKSKTLLVVEDDLSSRSLIRSAAELYGYHVLEADSGELGLAILKMHAPTAIMLDIKLPGISGMGMLESIKRMPKMRHVPVHMISGLDYQQNSLRLGAMGFLGKPLSKQGVQDAMDHIENVVSGRSKKLLVVEDDDKQRRAIVDLIAGEDIRIESVGTGAAALALLKEQHFDCIVLDLSLPDMVGGTFLSKLSELRAHLPPVIIYTGQELSREDEESLRRYAESIILKGVRSPERLLDEVNLFLHRLEDDLPVRQRDILRELRGRDQSFEGRKVLLVDDDIRNIFSLTHVLESRGFEVRIARDGIEALEQLKQGPPVDVVLMDIMMPRMDGYEAIRRIREDKKYGNVPIIALTAKAMKGDHEKCIEVGANDYLPKPLDVGSLMSVLKVWVGAKESLA
ncbi:MAG: response regulator, partial [Bdellovibrio sp.]